MSQRFLRCPHCGLPHLLTQTTCPATGQALKPPPSAKGGGEWDIPTAGPAPRPRQPPAPVPQAPAMRSNARRDLIGQTIGGRYMVKSVLGEGGMGTVYEAEHMGLGRAVAIKVLHPHQLKKKVSVKRFHQEARSAGAIGHPNICEVYDLGTLDDGSPYLVMEKLVGETLADRIASEGGLPFEDVIDVLTQVLSGLVAAHEKGIVHRDIKPENVFLTRRVGCPPVAKLLDFGVSKMMYPSSDRDEDMDLTRTGMVMGTPFYMSPEQARGDRNLDARVDLWACGVIMYEALTGRRPFVAANYNALLMQILTISPRPARELRAGMPQGFEHVLERAMERDRAKRYQNAAEFQADLIALRERLPVSNPAPVRRSHPPPAAPVAVAAPAPAPAAAPIAPPASVPTATETEPRKPPSIEVDIPVHVASVPGVSVSFEEAIPAPAEFDEAPTQVLNKSPRQPLKEVRADWDSETVASAAMPPLPQRPRGRKAAPAPVEGQTVRLPREESSGSAPTRLRPKR
jgi:serine/threonine-protein kinase